MDSFWPELQDNFYMPLLCTNIETSEHQISPADTIFSHSRRHTAPLFATKRLLDEDDLELSQASTLVESIKKRKIDDALPPSNAPEAQPATAPFPELRQQSLRFAGDLYTPQWVRNEKTKKEGLCELCPPPGKWLQLKNSAFWYHKQFAHGVCSITGKLFNAPLEFRIVWLVSQNAISESACFVQLIAEGKCHQCEEFINLSNSKKRIQMNTMSCWNTVSKIQKETASELISSDLDTSLFKLLAHVDHNGDILKPEGFVSCVSVSDAREIIRQNGMTISWYRHAHKWYFFLKKLKCIVIIPRKDFQELDPIRYRVKNP